MKSRPMTSATIDGKYVQYLREHQLSEIYFIQHFISDMRVVCDVDIHLTIC